MPWYNVKFNSKTLEGRLRRINRRLSKGKYDLSNKRSLVMARNSAYTYDLRRKPTPAEMIVGEWMWNNKIQFRFQKGFVAPFHRIVDFYLATRKLIIEVDGGYHQDTVAKDHLKDRLWLEKRSMRTIRVTNEQVYSGEFVKILLELITKVN